jgi:hypothetical protein
MATKTVKKIVKHKRSADQWLYEFEYEDGTKETKVLTDAARKKVKDPLPSAKKEKKTKPPVHHAPAPLPVEKEVAPNGD